MSDMLKDFKAKRFPKFVNSNKAMIVVAREEGWAGAEVVTPDRGWHTLARVKPGRREEYSLTHDQDPDEFVIEWRDSFWAFEKIRVEDSRDWQNVWVRFGREFVAQGRAHALLLK